MKETKEQFIIVAPENLWKPIEYALNAYGLETLKFYESQRAARQDAEYIPQHSFLLLKHQQESYEKIQGQHIFFLPFRLGRLLDRLLYMMQKPLPEIQSHHIMIGPYCLKSYEDLLVKGETATSIRLTEKERQILLALCHAGGSLNRVALLQDVWGYNPAVDTHTLETHIYRLRQKIEDDPAHPVLLVTDEQGYRLTDFSMETEN